MKYKVWCKNKKEFESDQCFLTNDGRLFQEGAHGNMIRLKDDTHIIITNTGMTYDDGENIYCGDRVIFITGEVGKIVFECGAFGVAFNECIDYEKIQFKMDELEWCCGNSYHGCRNDNFISLWEIHWNFNCDDDEFPNEILRKQR